MGIQLKNKSELDAMRRASMVVYEVHENLTPLVKPGVTTLELDEEVKKLCEKMNVVPAFLNYPCSQRGGIPFPGLICVSPNEVIVHGIPDNKPLKEGDILSIDFGCSINGFFGDSARTHAIGEISDSAKKLLKVTEDSLERAIEQCRVGNRIGDISYAVQHRVEREGFGIVREFVGHGIGSRMHEPPHVPNFGRPHQGRPLKAGMVLAIEPMVTVGAFDIKILSDGWTAVTSDGSLSAHFEHTVAITDKEPWVLSRP
jgi:methionyl aminopeptidase